jgi:hypothetical protein
MPIFGQVWLWSSLAFLLGALLCWVLVARPARRRVGRLEGELMANRYRRPAEPADRRALDEEYDAYDAEREERHARRSPVPVAPDEAEQLTRSYALPSRDPAERSPSSLRSAFTTGSLGAPPETSSPSERDSTDTELADSGAAATHYFNLGGSDLEAPPEVPPEVPAQPKGRGWFDSDAPGAEPLEATTSLSAFEPGQLGVGRLVDDEADAAPEPEPEPAARRGTVFSETTHPIPGELIRRLDESGEARRDEPADALVDDLADVDDAGSKAERSFESEPAATPGASKTGVGSGAEVASQWKPEPEPSAPDRSAQGQTEVMPAIRAESPADAVRTASGRRSGAEKSRPGTNEPKIMPGVTVSAEPAGNPLPKRVPGKPRGHTPFGVETSSKLEPVGAATATDGGGAEAASEPPRALFEPVVPAEDTPIVPPPHRVRGDGNGRGPFGPGSAMPLPDGGSPSPEFTIKASVSALRYCTPESPQFGRTIAEVWFKTPADAERVGFRPVT